MPAACCRLPAGCSGCWLLWLLAALLLAAACSGSWLKFYLTHCIYRPHPFSHESSDETAKALVPTTYMSVEIEWVETVKGGERRRDDSICEITTTRRALVACPPSATVADLRALSRLALGLGGEVLLVLLLHCC
jgi:hypothetical protein